ncbi:MAG: serine hydroxymethyltransferase [Methanobacteriota archaeon]|nr:MAG: serine hydroxymethyltransferase [Euryarchaeota archaeon]
MASSTQIGDVIAMGQSYFIRQMRAQQKWRLEDSINLLPSENITSPQVRALLSSDFGHRYTLPINAEYAGGFLENGYRGSRITTEIELSADKLACEVFGSSHACVQPLSGHIAAMIVIVSVVTRGDKMCSIPVASGGYDGYEQPYIPDILGLKASSLPFDASRYNLDSAKSATFIRRNKPRLVILGASFIPFPYDMGPVKDACEDAGSVLVYDGSHVLGLIAGGTFQKPLEEGAEILYGSTHKSFFGPQGGLIVTNEDGHDDRIRKNLTWRIVDNAHWNRVGALGQALLESKRFGKQYAKQVVKNSKKLGKELSDRGFPLMFGQLGFTESHQLLIDQKGVADKYGMTMNDFSVRVERSNLIIDSVARLGTSEITRMGMKEGDMPELADLFIEAAEGKNVRKGVKDLRERFDIAYTLS